MKRRVAIMCAWFILVCCAGACAEQTAAPETIWRIAEAFYAMNDVLTGTEGLTLSVTLGAGEEQGLWLACLRSSEGMEKHRLMLEPSGRICSYQNLAYGLPALTPGYPQTIGKSDDQWPFNNPPEIDAVMMRMRGWGVNVSECGGGISGTSVYLYGLDSWMEYVLLDMGGTAPTLLAYGDLQVESAGYPGFLTKKQAMEKAWLLLPTTGFLAESQIEAAVVEDAQLVMRNGLFSDEELPLPYWLVMISFREQTHSELTEWQAEQYDSMFLLLDARTGELLKSMDERSAANG